MPGHPAPIVSVITSTYNAAGPLLATAGSLRAQTDRRFEWIIVDGASPDGTAEVARGLGDLVSRLVSEPDTGIYNAWNKALPHVRGEWVLFLGAGDELYDESVLATFIRNAETAPPELTILYGKVLMMDGGAGVVRDEEWQGLRGPWTSGRPRLPSHQGVFQRASLFQRGFRFDERMRISADNEILLRELIAGRGRKLDMFISRFDTGGISFSPRNKLQMVVESVRINFKLGIFSERPLHQVLAVAVKLAKYPYFCWLDRTRRQR